jgi:hypothetical protein
MALRFAVPRRWRHQGQNKQHIVNNLGSGVFCIEMTSFKASGRVFVLGAGASVFAGYPIAAGLLPFVRTFHSREVTAQQNASQILGKIDEAELHFGRNIKRDSVGGTNLEELLTYLELYGSFPGTMFHLNPWTSHDSDSVRRVITDKFLGYQFDLDLWGKDESKVARQRRNIAEAWAKMLRNGDVIVTFNWDILHEIIFWHAGFWSYKDGYGFTCGPQGYLERDTEILLLKLHGSVNWVQNNENDSVSEIANVGDFLAGSRDFDSRTHFSQAQRDSGRKLVLPTYLKDISSNRVLLDLWTAVHSYLAQAQELFVVGYSLNKVDHPARLLFGTALSENRGLNEVTVVSPAQTEWPNFLFQLGKKMKTIRKKFEDWVID